MPSTVALAAYDLRKSYGAVPAVDGLSIEVRKGDVYGLLGRNGAGKTTTMRLLLGLVAPDGGSFRFGDDVATRVLPKHRARIGALVETAGFFPDLTAEENVRLLGGLSAPVSRASAERGLKDVGLMDVARRRASGFSFGMKRRLGLACALAGDPDVVLLDEPGNGLDPAGVRDLREIVSRLRAERGLTFLVSSHLLNEVERVATRLGVVRDGRLVAEGAPDDLLASLRRIAVVAAPVERARDVLSRFGVVSIERERLLLKARDDVARPDVARALVDSGVAVESFGADDRAIEDLVLGEGAFAA
jgi:ABC-2 type transport system ATP-binding protein